MLGTYHVYIYMYKNRNVQARHTYDGQNEFNLCVVVDLVQTFLTTRGSFSHSHHITGMTMSFGQRCQRNPTKRVGKAGIQRCLTATEHFGLIWFVLVISST